MTYFDNTIINIDDAGCIVSATLLSSSTCLSVRVRVDELDWLGSCSADALFNACSAGSALAVFPHCQLKGGGVAAKVAITTWEVLPDADTDLLTFRAFLALAIFETKHLRFLLVWLFEI